MNRKNGAFHILVDVLITAAQIAERSGIELALYLKDLCLDCTVLIISGFSCFGNLMERACRLDFQIAFLPNQLPTRLLEKREGWSAAMPSAQL